MKRKSHRLFFFFVVFSMCLVGLFVKKLLDTASSFKKQYKHIKCKYVKDQGTQQLSLETFSKGLLAARLRLLFKFKKATIPRCCCSF